MGGGFWDPKSIKNRSQNEVGQGRRPGIDFHAMLEDLGRLNETQNLLKTYVKTYPKQGSRNNGLWGASWVTKWSHNGAHDGPKGALGGVLEPRAAQEAPKRRPDPLQDSILDPSRPRF